MTAQDHQETLAPATTLANILARYVDSEGTFEGGDPFPVTIRYLNDHADVVGTAEAELFHAAEAAARQVTGLRTAAQELLAALGEISGTITGRDRLDAAETRLKVLLSAGDKAEAPE